MGLQLGVVGRWARFTLYLSSGSEDGMAVEVCSERGDSSHCHITTKGTSSGVVAGELESKVRHHFKCALHDAYTVSSPFPVVCLV